MSPPRVAVLGGGPAGVGAAYQLHRTGRAAATLLERNAYFGGAAGSFCVRGQYLDFGSHRLHPACAPEILDDIRSMLGEDLLLRPRRGRIRLRGRWLRFPLKPHDLLLRLDKKFAMAATRDMLMPTRASTADSPETFASVLRSSLGPTICEHFYFPYARKIWGREPHELSAIQARKRVTAGSFRKLLARLVRAPGDGMFYYPRRGYGQISQAYAKAAERLGAELLLGWTATRAEFLPQQNRWRVDAQDDGGDQRTVEADFLWSTLPIPILARITRPEPPTEVLEAAKAIQYRSMTLVYLELDVDRFTETDAHYFPEQNVRMTRLSEPKNYSGTDEPRERTTLCAEIPCQFGDEIWNRSDDELGALVAEDLARVGLALERAPTNVFARRLSHAYPIYVNGYEEPFEILDRWAASLPKFLTFGRQGLFAHDNTHHALAMAYAAVDCLEGGEFNAARWLRHREAFAGHVVED